jgi:hypothetical protein
MSQATVGLLEDEDLDDLRIRDLPTRPTGHTSTPARVYELVMSLVQAT